MHDGRDGRNIGEITLTRAGTALHFEQPGVSDVADGARVEAPSTIDAFVAVLRSVPGIGIEAVEPIEAGSAEGWRIDVTLSAAPGRWPRAIGGVDELCIAPDAVTR